MTDTKHDLQLQLARYQRGLSRVKKLEERALACGIGHSSESYNAVCAALDVKPLTRKEAKAELQPVSVTNDPNMTLEEWRIFIRDLEDRYGSGARMYTDAGHNNVDVLVEVTA